MTLGKRHSSRQGGSMVPQFPAKSLLNSTAVPLTRSLCPCFLPDLLQAASYTPTSMPMPRLAKRSTGSRYHRCPLRSSVGFLLWDSQKNTLQELNYHHSKGSSELNQDVCENDSSPAPAPATAECLL